MKVRKIKKDREVWKAIKTSSGWAVRAIWYNEMGLRTTAFPALCHMMMSNKEDAHLIAAAVNAWLEKKNVRK